jgi:hypothetical protein
LDHALESTAPFLVLQTIVDRLRATRMRMRIRREAGDEGW